VVALVSNTRMTRPTPGLGSVAFSSSGVGELMPRHRPYRIELSDEERTVLGVDGALVYVAVLAGSSRADGASRGARVT
jgi:hypothetical protein